MEVDVEDVDDGEDEEVDKINNEASGNENEEVSENLGSVFFTCSDKQSPFRMVNVFLKYVREMLHKLSYTSIPQRQQKLFVIINIISVVDSQK